MDYTDMLIQVATSFFGTLGFGFLFNIRGWKLAFAALGGMLSWGLFLALGFFVDSEPLRYFIVAVCSTVYSEILARALKTPASTFSIISLIPLVPGGALYDATTMALARDTEFLNSFIHTVELSVALSLGIVIVTAVSKHIFKPIHRG
ncbi:MAG: threonine/serine exporter [Ruminococcaceae bacterium]|nr:threonine/serine exporter [Oscillospiraceae bacterium]